MPIFEFICEDCQQHSELLVARNEQPECPSCRSSRMEKLMSAAAGRVSAGATLPIAGNCPPPEAGPCNPHCCRLPQ